MPGNCQISMAVHIAALLALSGGAPRTSVEIARSIDTNPVVVRRIVASLARAGLVSARRGASGGSVLARPADRITLHDLRAAVEAPDAFAIHDHPSTGCPVGRNIERVLSGVLGRAEAALVRELKRTTLAELVSDLQADAA
ncbi:MAG: Rrf2 family transcriptional regulator [Alphaproteobacteria bacterium]|nr:Rrf2 family transcriptional regulator [Alphaproteobacteria bacterium]